MAISVIFSGNPMVGTAGDDFIVADQNATVETNNTINAGDGDDLVIADAGHTHFLNSAVQNWSIETAYNLDDVTTWSTTENELLGNSALPHTTVITEATIGQPEYYSVTVGAGKQLIVDIDFGDNTPIGIPTNLALAIRDSSGNFLAGSDNSFTTDGGLGSFQINVPIVSLNSNDPYGGYTPTNAGLYYISVNSTVGTTTFTANNTFVMNVSVAGHAVGTNPVQGNDVINGGNGDDSLFGMGGADTINGGPGNDLISGGTGNNTVHGDDGDDVLVSSGEGLYFGDGGNDMVIAATTPGETLDGGPGSDTLDLTKWIFGDLTFDLGAGFTNSGQSYTNFENIITGEGNDKITGTSGANNISTKGGNDTVLAGAGNDTISGGFGNDLLTGGSGQDTFLDTVAKLNGDAITDLSNGDKIVITDASLNAGGSYNYSIANNTLTFPFGGGAMGLQHVPVGRIFVTAPAAGGVQLSFVANPHNDLNGNGMSDILWRDGNGLLFNWLATGSGGFISNAGAFATTISTEWRVAGTGDFNGDGRVDIFWRQDGTGHLLDWLGNAQGGLNTNPQNFDSSVPANVHVVGTGDFNGDGRDDILFRNDTGLLFNWLGQPNGGFANNTANFATVISTEWRVIGTGDFNGDGYSDILWRQDGTGHLLDWLGNGSGGFNTNAANFDSAMPFNVHYAGTGDFNGDGITDILWRDESGLLFNWLGNSSGGFAPNTGNFATVISTEWRVVSVGDFNGDGMDDVLWRQDVTGHLLNWLGTTNGGFVTNSAHFDSSVPGNLQVQDPFL